MNILKNFEALFVVTLGLAGAANYVLADAPQTQATEQASYTAPAAQNMQVVVVSAKRLSAAEKKQSLLEESQTASAANTGAARKI